MYFTIHCNSIFWFKNLLDISAKDLKAMWSIWNIFSFQILGFAFYLCTCSLALCKSAALHNRIPIVIISKCKSFLNPSGSDIYLHRDTNLMPKNPAAWSSWNFLGDVNNKVCLTYWLNVLQVSNPVTWFMLLSCITIPKHESNQTFLPFDEYVQFFKWKFEWLKTSVRVLCYFHFSLLG